MKRNLSLRTCPQVLAVTLAFLFTANLAYAARATAIASGSYHTCAVSRSGRVLCWGWNADGQLGDGTTYDRKEPVDIGLAGIVGITAGASHTCALTGAGGVKCWGSNRYGELGDGTKTSRSVPVDVEGLGGSVVALGAGHSHTCAVTTAGALKCWGRNAWGQLGDGTNTDRLAPADVLTLSGGVQAVAGGDEHTCALTTAGGVQCWGWNMFGQLGDLTFTNRATPASVYSLSSGVTALAIGHFNSCALTAGGEVKCWGDNRQGLLGVGGTWDYNPSPSSVQGLGTGVVTVASGFDHLCAVTAAGSVKCWGHNENGMLGDGTAIGRASPVDAIGQTGAIVGFGLGYRHSCSLTAGGAIACWGDNYYGELGVGSRYSSRLTATTVRAFAFVPDFDGDGQPDIAWRDRKTGEVVIWMMKNLDVAGEARIPGPGDPGWQLSAVADFNDDENPDLLWRRAATGENEVWYMQGTVQAGTAAMPIVADAAWRIAAAADFDLDGHADIVWRNQATGDNVIWFMHDATMARYTRLPSVAGSEWQIAGAADFDADGRPEILWRNTARGDVVLWLTDRGAYTSYTKLPDCGVEWAVAATGDSDGDGRADITWTSLATGLNRMWYVWALPATGPLPTGSLSRQADASFDPLTASDGARTEPSDFNADGYSDILWRNASTGNNRMWSLLGADGLTIWTIPPEPDTAWHVAGTGDFDGDGKPDIAWRNGSTGANRIWKMDGSTRVSETSFNAVTDPAWRIVGVGDFSGDGQADLVWRNEVSGDAVVWEMVGGQYRRYTRLPLVADASWRIVGVGDFNGDGQNDLVWRQAVTGENVVWFMNGAAYAGYSRLRNLEDPQWQIAGVGDYSGDGRADLLWRHATTGRNIIWFMNGTTFLGYHETTAEPDASWQIGY